MFFNSSLIEIPLDKEHLEIGDSVIAKYSDDNRWYRGVIMSFKITDEDTKKRRRSSLKERELEYEVLYIDFGSKEWVKMEKLRPVKETFFELPIETLPCCLADVDPIGKCFALAFSYPHSVYYVNVMQPLVSRFL